MKLIIVESPTKSKTLGNFLPKDYQVVSTMGHIRDLPVKSLGIKIEKGETFDFLPEYVFLEKKKEVISKLKAEIKKATQIFLATDPDREGEAIAWHTTVLIGKEKKKNLARISFHEITKKAIEKALAEPGEINLQLVDAQQARRILDRLVGYKLSPLLWRKIRRGLSAGRGQSVAARLAGARRREVGASPPAGQPPPAVHPQRAPARRLHAARILQPPDHGGRPGALRGRRAGRTRTGR